MNRPSHPPLLPCMVGFFLILAMLGGCVSVTPTLDLSIKVEINVDQSTLTKSVPAGASVQRALELAGITIGNLDRVDPPGFTAITEPISINVTRVKEEFENEEVTIPFSQQVVRNESLPEGQTLRIQAGENGTNQLTYRLVFENGAQISRSIVKTTVITEPKPEILMVGVKAPFIAQIIPGRLVYIIAGNAWMMEGTTAERTPLITTGDLDGRVLHLSSDGKWLLYTRTSGSDPSVEINTLWAANLAETPIRTYNLKVKNVLNFADWVPGEAMSVLYSTVEPRSAAPGWQANNDLNLLKFTRAGNLTPVEEIIAPNSGGLYGWWGTQYQFSSDGKTLLYSRPDSVGMVDLKAKALVPWVNTTPYQTRSNWAWVPGVTVSPSGQIVYTVSHPLENGVSDAESSQLFDLSALNTKTGVQVSLVADTGMFSYPAASPQDAAGRFSIAFLKAVFPRQSADSRYRLWVMDQDGSNPQALFPPADSSGLDPQQVRWSPASAKSDLVIALIYQGNLWLINPATAGSVQVTGDGLMTQFDWK